MSLEQYKDANRKDLWDILQIQMQVLQAEVAKNAELEKEIENLVGEFAEAECLGEVAKMARMYGYTEQD
jgi:uncharacterized protein YqeY